MHILLEESKQIKSQADSILKESGIIEILKNYGEVKIGGSYALDVMLRPDIDLFVVTNTHDWNRVLDIQSKIMKSKYFREFDFVNWVDFEDQNLTSIKGYYFQPWVPVNGQLWKIDIWLITFEHDKSSEHTEYFQKLLNQAGEAKKITILEIKKAMRQGKKYINGVDGKLIYKAVLENNVNSVKEFETFLLKNPSRNKSYFMTCPNCKNEMAVKKKDESVNSKDNKKYERTVSQCQDCDTWVTIEIPK